MNRIEAMVEASKRVRVVVPQEKACSTCGEVKGLSEYPSAGTLDGRGYECSHCAGVRANAWWKAAPMKRRRALNAVKYAVKSGRLPVVRVQTCVECGAQAEHHHHSDYDEPLEVTALCRACHVKLHKEQRKAG